MSGPGVHAGVDGGDGFASSRECFEATVAFLEAEETSGFEHGELEERLEARSRELFRRLFQDHLNVRTEREQRLDGVTDAAGTPRPRTESGHHRHLVTVFGEVDVCRMAYRQPGEANLHPADAALNLPEERHSHGLRRWAAIEASRGSFDAAVDAIARATGQTVGKRQLEGLVRRAAADVASFYAQRSCALCDPDDVVVISVDGKGIVMRPDALREATRRASETSRTKLGSRLSRGEKRGRKRMAELGAVYDLTAVARVPADIFPSGDHQPLDGPLAKNKWLTASVVDDAAEVIAEVFDEGERRDPHHQRTWVALVDGNSHQIDRIHVEASNRNVTVTVLIDLIHVLEYLWSAAWSFFAPGDPAAETWVRDRALAILAGGARDVAAGIRRRSTNHRIQATQRRNADACADYLTNKAAYLDYPTALTNGWPIATGIIEGACRHIVKDRMDLTGARWGLDGAEAILKLRTLNSNGDLNDYWPYHLQQERQRIHNSRYRNGVIPQAA